jgi:hypothetical protein
MTPKTEAKRVKHGQSVADYESAITNCVNRLKLFKSQLAQLKTDVDADPDYDVTDAAEVQAAHDGIATQVATI